MIKGKAKEQTEEFVKKVGIMEARVVAVNPDEKEYEELLKKELAEGSQACEYLSESRDGNKVLRVDFWLEEVKTTNKYKVAFFIEDKYRQNKDETKYQYINNIGNCAWGEDEESLPDWFTKRDFKKAHSGEEEMYDFIRTWLGGLDYRDADTSVELDWKNLMKGNVKALKDQIDGEFSTNVGAMLIIVSKEKDDEIVEYQNIYNRAFLPVYSLKHFKLVDYSDPKVLSILNAKKSKDLKAHERFVLKVTGEYGCKDYFKLVPLEDYNPDDNVVNREEVMTEEDSGGADY